MSHAQEDEEQYQVIPARRSAGETSKQLLEFYTACRKGESVVLATPEGNIGSPEYIKRLIAAAREQSLAEVREQMLALIGEYEPAEEEDWDCACGKRHHDTVNHYQTNRLRAELRQKVKEL